MPSTVVVEAELVLGGLEGVLDRPAPALDRDERRDRGARRAPRREEREIAFGEVAPDQQAAGPEAHGAGDGTVRPEVGELELVA